MCRQEVAEYGNVRSYPRIKAWREAMGTIGVSGRKFLDPKRRCSGVIHEAVAGKAYPKKEEPPRWLLADGE